MPTWPRCNCSGNCGAGSSGGGGRCSRVPQTPLSPRGLGLGIEVYSPNCMTPVLFVLFYREWWTRFKKIHIRLSLTWKRRSEPRFVFCSRSWNTDGNISPTRQECKIPQANRKQFLVPNRAVCLFVCLLFHPFWGIRKSNFCRCSPSLFFPAFLVSKFSFVPARGGFQGGEQKPQLC